MKTLVARLTLSFTTVCCTCLVAHAGPLNPPPGPVQTTGRTQVNQQYIVALPYVITQPGSYVLTSNIVGDFTTRGIEIQSSNVTIDLNGFALINVIAMGRGVGGLEAIVGTVPDLRNIAIRNGSMMDWGGAGISLTTASNVEVENIRVYGCQEGIVTGYNSMVTDCVVEANSSRGIGVGNSSVVNRCTALLNGNGGIRAGAGASIAACVAENNTYGGIFAGVGSTIINSASRRNSGAPAVRRGGGSGSGFETGGGCTFANCTAEENNNDGFNVQEGCNFANCSAHLNTASGFNATDDVNISHSSATQNSFIGMWVNGGAITDSTCGRNGFHGISSFFQPLIVKHCNTSVNGVNGIVLDAAGGRVESSAAFQNGEDGINVANGCIVTACTAYANTDDGIQVNATCTVVNNTCSEQRGTGAGIHVVSNENRIDGNHCAENDRGMKVDVGGNVIIHNSASGNGAFSYVLANGNDVGPIGSAATSTSPWANIGVASAPTCSDGVQNGSETGIDCGGGTCPPCGAGQGCLSGADCVSGICMGGICQP